MLEQAEKNVKPVELKYAKALADAFLDEKKMLQLEMQIYDSIGYEFNINSSQQLANVLFGQLKLPRSRKTKSGYSTQASVLQSLK